MATTVPKLPPAATQLVPVFPTFTPEELAVLPHDNAGPRLNVVMWVLIAVSTSFLAMRVYCKFARHNRLWWDDHILIAAWVCIVIESCCLSSAISLGYGYHIWDSPLDSRIMPLINVAGTFTIIAAIWSKTSFAITLLRLTDGWMKRAVWFIIISMNIAMGLSALFAWIQCTPLRKAWDIFIPGQCWDPKVIIYYDIFSAAYSALMDFALAILPWKLIWRLQMRRKEKIGVALAMSMGIFAGVTSIIKITKIPTLFNPDFYFQVDLWIWGNAETNVTIVAASIPVLRVLVKEVKSSARRYYVSTEDHATNRSGYRNQHTITISAGRNSRHQRIRSQDAQSDKSILDDKPGIVRTKEVAVEYHKRGDRRDEDIELARVG